MNSFSEVEKCVLESNGTFYLEGVTPNSGEIHRREVLDLVRSLSAEVKELKVLLAARG